MTFFPRMTIFVAHYALSSQSSFPVIHYRPNSLLTFFAAPCWFHNIWHYFL